MQPTVQILVDGATNVIELRKLRNKLAVKGSPEEYPNDATVTLVALNDANNQPIPGTENLAMDWVDGTTGKKTAYRVTLDETIDLTVGQNAIADILAEVAGGVRPFKIKCKVVEG